MKTIKINNKNYIVPELTFRHFSQMEEQGFSVLEAFQKKQMFLLAMGFVCAVTGEDRNEAERLIEQHILGGGTIEDIMTAFGEAATFSGALIGVDYKYKFDKYKIAEDYRHKRDMMDRHFAEANKHIDEIEEEYDITDTDRRD